MAAEKGKLLEKAIWQAAVSLGELGRIAEEKGLQDAKREAAKYLAELTILSEENVKTAIHDYQSELEEKDGVFFQKFGWIYGQELEKLRADKRTATIFLPLIP